MSQLGVRRKHNHGGSQLPQLPPSQVNGYADSEDLLFETRKLLNALNEENAELKSQNNILSDKLRRATDAITSVNEEKDALEKDMKQINLNLMQQLKSKATSLRDCEAQLAKAQERCQSSAAASQLAEQKQSELEAEVVICRERIASLEEANRQLQRRVSDATSHSQDGKAHAAELTEELRRVREELKRERFAADESRANLLAELERERKRAMESEAEQAAATETMSRHIASLSKEANRASVAETESLFAHDQMLAMSTHMTDQLGLLHEHTRDALQHVAQSDLAMGQQIDRVKQLSTSLQLFREHDNQLIEYMLSERRQCESDTASKDKELEKLRTERTTWFESTQGTTFEMTRLKQSLQLLTEERDSISHRLKQADEQATRSGSQLQEATEQLRAEQCTNEKLRRGLIEADAALSISADANQRLEAELASQRANIQTAAEQHHHELLQLTQQHESEMRALHEERLALEDEIDALHVQLREHSETLTHALNRMSHLSHQSVRSQRRSTSYLTLRSMSTDSSVAQQLSSVGAKREQPDGLELRVEPSLSSESVAATQPRASRVETLMEATMLQAARDSFMKVDKIQPIRAAAASVSTEELPR